MKSKRYGDTESVELGKRWNDSKCQTDIREKIALIWWKMRRFVSVFMFVCVCCESETEKEKQIENCEETQAL